MRDAEVTRLRGAYEAGDQAYIHLQPAARFLGPYQFQPNRGSFQEPLDLVFPSAT